MPEKVNCNTLGQNNQERLRKFLVEIVNGTLHGTDSRFHPDRRAPSCPVKRESGDSHTLLRNALESPALFISAAGGGEEF